MIQKYISNYKSPYKQQFKIILVLFFQIFVQHIFAQEAINTPTESVKSTEKPSFKHAFYFQWGYNREKYTKSDIYLKGQIELENKVVKDYDFVIHQAEARDKPDFDALIKDPLQITIPQYSYRIGMFLDEKRTAAVELNFDHTKYVIVDWQTARVTGNIFGQQVDKDMVLDPDKFIHFEHTNGANFLQANYVRQWCFLKNKAKTHTLLTGIGKIGAGIVIPKTDVTLFGKRLDNEFHIAGYVASAEAGVRYYPFQRRFFDQFFLEATGKGGFANYSDVLTVDTGKANHTFWYLEGIFLIGYEWTF